MTAADDAYAAALQEIARVKAAGETSLSLDAEAYRALTTIPPQIADIPGLWKVDLDSTQVTDLTPLQGLTGLTDLTLTQTGVTDLSPLRGLTGLTVLDLDHTRITDLTPLRGLTGLTDLTLNQTGVTDLTPLRGLTGLTGLWLNQTKVTDLSPLRGLTGLTRLWLDQTGVADLTPLRGLTGLTELFLGQTAVTDLTPLRLLTNLETLAIDRTHISDVSSLAELKALRNLDLERSDAVDLRPIIKCYGLLSPILFGLNFVKCSATERDARLAELSAIGDPEIRARETLAYLNTLPPWPDPYTPRATPDGSPPRPIGPETTVAIPEPILAPLQIEERDGRLSPILPGDALDDSGRVLAREGWEALRDYLDDLADLRPRIVNQTPMLARALTRFETALGQSYENARPIAMGTHGQHVIAQAGVAGETMDTDDATALRSFAVAIGIFLERFPEWRDYRDAAPLPPVDPAKAAEALAQFDSVANEAAKHPDEIAPEIAQSLKDQVSAVRDMPDDPVARRGILDSTQNFLSEAARVSIRWVKTETKDVVKLVWSELKKTATKGLVVAILDIWATKATGLKFLAATFPEQFGWLLPFLKLLGL